MENKNLFRNKKDEAFLPFRSPIFYISALGSSASNWMNKMLSRHPKIVCFGSTRSFPPVWPGFTHPHKDYWYPWVQEISAEKFIQSLALCAKSTHNEKIFGSIHGYHGLSAKNPCEIYGGIFSYIARNPISRIHSVFIHGLDKNYYSKFTKIKNSEIHQRSCELLKDQNLVVLGKKLEEKKIKKNNFLGLVGQNIKKFLPQATFNFLKNKKEFYRIKSNSKKNDNSIPDEKKFIAEDFVVNVREFLRHDSILHEGCDKESGIKMEEFVKSPEYFKNVLINRVDSNIQIKQEYLDSVFSEEKRFWIHRDKPIGDREIWETWPKSMQELYLYYFEKFKINNFCKTFDYDITFL